LTHSCFFCSEGVALGAEQKVLRRILVRKILLTNEEVLEETRLCGGSWKGKGGGRSRNSERGGVLDTIPYMGDATAPTGDPGMELG